MPSISVSRESETRVKADITVNSAELKHVEEQAIKIVGARAEIKGFRKGKAPAHLIRQKFAPDIRLATLFALVDNHLSEVEKKIAERVYRVVRIENVQEKGDKMSFAVKLDLFPYVKIGKLKVAQLTRHTPAIDDADIEQEIKDRLLSFAEFVDAGEGASAEKNDRLTVDFEIWVDDAPSGAVNKDFQFDLGSGSLSRELEEQIIDKKGKVGEEFKLRKHTAVQKDGKTHSYEIIATIKKISKPKLPELTDALVVEKFRGARTVAEFRNNVREDLEKRFELAMIHAETDKALKTLKENAQFFLSESFIEQKLKEFLEERKIERDELTAPQVENLRKVLGDREKPELLMRQLINDAEKNYQKRNKTDITYIQAFRKYIHDEITPFADVEERDEALFKELNAVIDSMIAGETNRSPWEKLVSTYLADFNRRFLFDYFENEGIVKKGKKLTYKELVAYLAQNTSV